MSPSDFDLQLRLRASDRTMRRLLAAVGVSDVADNDDESDGLFYTGDFVPGPPGLNFAEILHDMMD